MAGDRLFCFMPQHKETKTGPFPQIMGVRASFQGGETVYAYYLSIEDLDPSGNVQMQGELLMFGLIVKSLQTIKEL